MAAQNKIVKYNLQDRTLALSVDHNHKQIAGILTKELDGQDTISQPTVSRFIKRIRKEREETAKGIVTDYMKESLPADLRLLDEVATFHLAIFRGKLVGKVNGKELEKISLTDQRVAARDLHEILKTKFRFVGVPDGDLEGEGVEHPVDLNDFKVKPEQNEGKETENG